jgi:T5SS/PEP-CTERM-associated repeat protein
VRTTHEKREGDAVGNSVVTTALLDLGPEDPIVSERMVADGGRRPSRNAVEHRGRGLVCPSWVLAALAVAMLMGAAEPLRAGEFVFDDFSSTAGLALNSSASAAGGLDGNVLRVVPAGFGLTGSAFSSTSYNIGGGFHSFFTFQINDNDTVFNGADGLVFVLQSDPAGASALGGGGGFLGYGPVQLGVDQGITHSIGVAFDVFMNSSPGSPYDQHDPSGNFIAIHADGNVVNGPGDTIDLTGNASVSLKDQHRVYAWIDCDGNTLSVFASENGLKPASPLLSRPFLVSGLDTAHTLVGFTAATGGGYANFDVQNWKFNNNANGAYGNANGGPFIDIHADGDNLFNGGAANWADANAWQERQVPTLANNVFLGSSQSALGPYAMTVTDSRQAQSLHLTGNAASNLQAALSVAGADANHLAALTVAAEMQVDAGNTLQVGPFGSLSVADGAPVTNQGLISLVNGGSAIFGANVRIDQTDQGNGAGRMTASGNGSGFSFGSGTIVRGGALSVTGGGFISATGTTLTYDGLYYDADLVLAGAGFQLFVIGYPNNSTITGSVQVSGSTLTVQDATLAVSPDGGATWKPVTVSGDGLGNSGTLQVYSSTVSNGSATFSNGGAADMQLAGWNVHGDLVVDNGSTAVVSLSNNTSAQIDGQMRIGDAPGATGTVTFDGAGTLVFTGQDPANQNVPPTGPRGDVLVGAGGVGALWISGGAALVTPAPFNGYVGLYDNGDGTGGSGSVTVTGADGAGNPSLWQFFGGDLSLGDGNYTYGQINILAGGKVTVGGSVHIGVSSGQGDFTGDIEISNAGAPAAARSTLHADQSILVGEGTVGQMRVLSGGLAENLGDAFLGVSGAGAGYATVDGTGTAGTPSEWQVGGILYVGYHGYGSLNVTNGARVTSGSQGLIGSQGDGQGYVYVVGTDGNGNPSLWTVNGLLHVGDLGYGELQVWNGGRVATINGHEARIGANSGSLGLAEVFGTGAGGNPSTWDIDTFLEIGDGGTGTLNVTAGGQVNTHFVNMAFFGGASGTAVVDGNGSALTLTPDLVGNTGTLVVGVGAFAGPADPLASATLTISNGGLVTNQDAHIGRYLRGHGMVTVDAGTWTNNWYVVVGEEGFGRLEVRNGGLVSISGDLDVGLGSAEGNAVAGTGGELSILSGGRVTGHYVSVAYYAPGVGHVTVDGPGSVLSQPADLLDVGVRGTATLTVSNGGMVASGYGVIGDVRGASGAVTVTGVHSGVRSTWAVAPANYLIVGLGNDDSNTVTSGVAQGSLSILDGGLVTSGPAYIASYRNSSGTALVSGVNAAPAPSTWAILGGMDVGQGWDVNGTITSGAGVGLLTVQQGGLLTTTGLFLLGDQPNGQGTVVLTDPNTRIGSDAEFVVGWFGTGSLTASNGALLQSHKLISPTNSAGVLGVEANGIGAATVTGAGSRWENVDGSLSVGLGNNGINTEAGGTGVLRVEHSGVVTSINGYIARFPGSTGKATVTDSNSMWLVTGNLYIGGNETAGSGTPLNNAFGPQLHIDHGGQVQVAPNGPGTGVVRIWDRGEVDLDGGTLTAAAVQNNGVFHVISGSHAAGDVLGIDANVLSGTTLIDPSATLTASRIVQGTLVVEGTLFASEIYVGGSSSGKSGVGTFAVSGGHAVLDHKLVVWSGSTASLGLGTVVSSDANHPALDLSNDGMLEVGDGNGTPVVYALGVITGNGDVVIGSGATLWVESLTQNSVQIDAGGTLVFAAQDPQQYAATAMRNYELAVPEPGTLFLIGLGGALFGWRRKGGAS